jgi:hypothetical protein
MQRWLRGDEAQGPKTVGRQGAYPVLLTALVLALLAFGPAWATDTDCDGNEFDGGDYTCAMPGITIPDISGTGISITKWPNGNSDDGYFDIEMPSTFRWYGQNYDIVYISTNGFVSFGSAGANREMRSTPNNPNGGTPNATVYAYGDDLDPSAGGNVYYQLSGTCNSGGDDFDCFIVRWDGVPQFGGAVDVTVSLGLDMTGSSRAVVEITAENGDTGDAYPQILGTENADGSAGLWYLADPVNDTNSGGATTGDEFVFSPEADTTPPTVTSTTPSDGATGVAVGANIVVNFDEAMNTGSVTLTVEQGTDPGGFSPSWSNGDTRVTYTHNDFDEWTDYILSITGDDLVGNTLDPSNSPETGPAGCGTTKYCWGFRTEDTTAPAAAEKQTTTSADIQVDVEWADLPTGQAGGPSGVLVLQKLAEPVPDTPTDGQSYSIGDSVGTSTVVCNEEDASSNGCTDSFFVTNGNTYYYKSFVYDEALNYSPGNETVGIPKSDSNFDWAYTSEAAILNRVVPIPNQQTVGIGNDQWLHRLGHGDGLRSGWDPPVVGAAVQGAPNAVDISFDGTADLTAFVSAQDGFIYRFGLDADGPAENSLDVIDYLDTQGTACTGFGILQASPVVMFDEFNQANTVTDDVVVQPTRCGSSDNAVVLMDHTLSVLDTYTDTAADGSGDSTPDGLGISNAKPRLLYREDLAVNNLVYVPLRAGDTEESSLVVLEIANAGGGTPGFGDPAYATLNGFGGLDASPGIARRGSNRQLLIGNTNGELYLFDATARVGSAPDYSLNQIDAYTDAATDGAVTGVSIGNGLAVGGSHVNYVVWTTDTTVHGITIGLDGRFDESSYWSQSISTPSEPLVLQYGGNTYAYVGAGDGYVYELDARDGGTVTESFLIEAGTTVGDVSIDIGAGPGSPGTQGLTAGTTSGRIYWVALN